MADEKNITAAHVREIISYNPGSGEFIWIERPVSMFSDGAHSAEHSCAKWNARYAGKSAGSIDNNGYRQIHIFYEIHYAHRLAWLVMTGEWPKYEIDHINLDPSDNRWDNLRGATASQNQANKSIYRNNTSGFKGVSWSKARQKWRARIAKDGREQHLGLFETASAAYAAYIAAANRINGEFARTI